MKEPLIKYTDLNLFADKLYSAGIEIPDNMTLNVVLSEENYNNLLPINETVRKLIEKHEDIHWRSQNGIEIVIKKQ